MLGRREIFGNAVDAKPAEAQDLSTLHGRLASARRGKEHLDVRAEHADLEHPQIVEFDTGLFAYLTAYRGLGLFAPIDKAAGQSPTRKRSQNMIKQQNLFSRV